jgi:hypothetical protein
MFEKRVFRRIFGSTREKEAGGWRRLHNEELRNLYASPYTCKIAQNHGGDRRGM